MYRLLLTILLCLKAASSAPQGKESDVTFVKIQPMVEDSPADSTSTRESRIEKLPLTFPGNVSATNSKEPDKNLAEKTISVTKNERSEKIDSSELSGNTSKLPKTQLNLSDLPESLDLSETNLSETVSNPNGTEESDTTDDLSEVNPTDDLSESNTDNLSDTVPSETNQSDRRARNFDSVETTETIEDATGKYEDGIIDHTVIDAPRTKAPPKFLPKVPKSSYFPKPFNSYSANHLDIVGKRKFRSKCSCQKIWNCPKLQITVPRCPDEYFLCCF